MKMHTQDDHVKEELGYQPEEMTRKVTLPGMAKLHEKPIAEIAEALANVLRSEREILKLTYHVGESIEITFKNPLA